MTPVDCACPESMRLYRDLTIRDGQGRLLASTRTITCQRCNTVLSDTTRTWEPR